MQQVLFGGWNDALNSSTTEYGACSAIMTLSATEMWGQQIVTTPGTLSSLYVELSAAPGAGAGDGYSFTLRVNGVDTSLTCTVTQPATSASDTAHSVNVVAGDLISIKIVPLNTPSATPTPQWSLLFTGTQSKESLLLGATYTNPTTTEYAPITQAGPAYQATENDVRRVIPTAGTIKNLYVALSDAPGTGKSYAFTLRKGGVSQTLTTTINGTATTGNDTAHSVSVAAGDIVTLMITPSGTPSTTPLVSFGMTFVSDTDGESIVLGGSGDDLSNSVTEYNQLNSGWNATAWNTEAVSIQLGQVCVLKKLYMLLSGDPGSGYVFTVRKNTADTTLTCNMGTTGNDTTHEVTLAAGDNIALKCVPTGTPTVRDAYWGLVCYIAPPATILSSPVCFDMAVV